jgi:hypothetical protein
MLEEISGDAVSGTLTATSGDKTKKLTFRQGHLTFCSSNDPRETIGQAFLQAGLVTEAELAEALRIQKSVKKPLGQILNKLGSVTQDEIIRVMKRKTLEGILDLYLWLEGTWALDLSPPPGDDDIRLPLAPIRKAGHERMTQWARLRERFADLSTSLQVHPDRFPTGFPDTAGEKRLVDLASKGRSLSFILLELRGQDYAVLSQFDHFVAQGWMSLAGDAPAAGPAQSTEDEAGAAVPEPLATETVGRAEPRPQSSGTDPVQTILAAAYAALKTGELDEARAALGDVLVLDPNNEDARLALAQIKPQTPDAAAGPLGPETVLTLARDLDELLAMDLPPSHAFIISRLAGPATRLADLISVCPLPAPEIHDAVETLLAQGIVAVSA